MASFAAVCGETWYVRGFTLGSQMGAGDRNLLYPENICIFCLSERSDTCISVDGEARCLTALCVGQRVGTEMGN